MKKIAVISLSLMLLTFLTGFAQQRLDFTGNGETDHTSGYFTKYIVTEKYVNIDGSPYFNDDWKPGIIKLVSGVELKIESCKYDVYEGKLLFMKDETPLYFSSPQDIAGFTIGDTKFVNLKQQKNNEFYECLYGTENLKLLKEYNCIYVKGKETDGINPATRDKYALDFEYFLKKGDNIEKLKLKEKSVLELLGDKKNEVKGFISENKLNCKKEEDVIKILEYYATLM